MPRRYQLPRHTSSVFAPTREIRADKNGQISLADDAPLSEHDALIRAGASLIDGEAAAKPKAPAKPKPAGAKAGKPKAAPANAAEPDPKPE